MVDKYNPILCEGIYKDIFNKQFIKSISNGIICECSRKKTIFKIMSKFTRHCRGKIHQKYLKELTNKDNLDIIEEKVEEKEKIEEKSSNIILNMKDISLICNEKIVNMEGNWIVPKNNYEKDFCTLLGWECISNRYYDATINNNVYIEIKKGISGMWLDMIGYSEILLGIGKQDTITVFLNWNKKLKRINRIFIINTKILIDALGLTKDIAKSILHMKKLFPGRINHLQCITINRIKDISKYIIKHPQYKN